MAYEDVSTTKALALKGYLGFTKSMWGLLSNFSVVFPFSALLSEHATVPPRFAALGSVICAGIILAIWVGRTDSWLFELRGGVLLNLTVCGTIALLLGAGIISIFLYSSFELSQEVHFVRICLYLIGFSGVTAGFSALGLKEYFLTQDDLGFDVRSV